MNPEQLYFYLKGFIELGNGGLTTPGPETWANIVQNVKAVKVSKCGCKSPSEIPGSFFAGQPAMAGQSVPEANKAPTARPPDTVVKM